MDAVAEELLKEKLLLSVRLSSGRDLEKKIEAAVRGGMKVIEITMTTPGALECIRNFSGEQGLVIGAGTVMKTRQVDDLCAAGAEFIMSPGHNEEVVKAALDKNILPVPGALTPTEVLKVHSAGLPIVKVFPLSSMGGADYIRALKGPLPAVKLLASGGVRLANIQEHLRAGTDVLAAGSEIINDDSTPAEICSMTQRYLEEIRRIEVEK